VQLLALLLLAFILVPLVELSLLLLLGAHTYWWLPLAVVIVTGACGAWLARLQGFQTYRRIQQDLREGRLPADSLLDAAMIFVAGALLLTPGMLTDLFGFSLLLPPCRRFYKRAAVRWAKANFRVRTFAGPGTGPGDFASTHRDRIIDSYVVDRSQDPDDAQPG
jgi:UPF0716 protein FxsA